MKYKILCEVSTRDLEEVVDAHLDKGYVLWGGLLANGVNYKQVVIKEAFALASDSFSSVKGYTPNPAGGSS